MAVTPTPDQPIIRNDDGSISQLVYQGRTHRINFIHEGLTYPPTGYKARYGLTDKYGNALLVSANSVSGPSIGTITFSDASLLPVTDEHPLAWTGTLIAVEIPDELMNLSVKLGKFDCVLEEPSGGEVPLGVGDWIIWKAVTP